tara:strand:- start:456 stop:890 length:435 start_codon:yes stop_codon:yes gene_type:complete
MQELIWFLLGVVVCSILVRLTLLMHKIYLLSQFKHYAFQLIYYSYQQLIFSTVSKYILLENSEDVSKEHIKVMKNEDSIFINEWKKSVSEGLKTQLPITLRPALKYDSWDEILNQMSNKFIKCIEKDFEKELEKVEETYKQKRG